MSIVLIGGNPGLLLHSEDGPTAAASLWTVDWSIWGSGVVLMAVDRSGWRTVGTDEHLARILLERFNLHFPEFSTFADDRRVQHVDAEVEIRSDLRSGLQALGGGIELRLADVKDRRQFSDPAFPLGELTMSLANVYLPCGMGELTIDGERIAGRPQCVQQDGRWTSSGYLAVAEVWSDPAGEFDKTDPIAPATEVKPRHLYAIGSG